MSRERCRCCSFFHAPDASELTGGGGVQPWSVEAYYRQRRRRRQWIWMAAAAQARWRWRTRWATRRRTRDRRSSWRESLEEHGHQRTLMKDELQTDRRSSRRRSPWCRRHAAATPEHRRSSSLSSTRSAGRPLVTLSHWTVVNGARSAGRGKLALDSHRRWSRMRPRTGWRWGSMERRLEWGSNRCRDGVRNESQDRGMNLSKVTCNMSSLQ